ncbi:putative EXOIII [Lyophyllum shimeji]|uniref:RNA exonuclease 4 n=1 Tax=Lyophyllum shimeji TaxID=47721 RepID=A0A9P3PH99_LYOSH|nr:putative EXOIII [Lyophyllum shimeji]
MAPSSDLFLAMSCSNVGVGPGGTTSMVARVVIVDYRGKVIFDKYVAPTMQVTDYRTSTTGITEAHLSSGNVWPFNTVQQYVASLIDGKILVGHSIWNDLSVLGIPHPAVNTRDVAVYLPFRNALRSPHQIIGLQTLAWQLMCRRCQEGQQHPVENARVALDLYRSDAESWESAIQKGNWPCALPPSTFSRCYL